MYISEVQTIADGVTDDVGAVIDNQPYSGYRPKAETLQLPDPQINRAKNAINNNDTASKHSAVVACYD